MNVTGNLSNALDCRCGIIACGEEVQILSSSLDIRNELVSDFLWIAGRHITSERFWIEAVKLAQLFIGDILTVVSEANP